MGEAGGPGRLVSRAAALAAVCSVTALVLVILVGRNVMAVALMVPVLVLVALVQRQLNCKAAGSGYGAAFALGVRTGALFGFVAWALLSLIGVGLIYLQFPGADDGVPPGVTDGALWAIWMTTVSASFGGFIGLTLHMLQTGQGAGWLVPALSVGVAAFAIGIVAIMLPPAHTPGDTTYVSTQAYQN